MALAATTIWEMRSGSTAGNVNGGGFNTANANFLTDFTTDTNTANTDSPVLSSASYNFVAGDVGAWAYVSTGTNWTPGFYKIASVATNKATLSAAVGEAVQYDASMNRWKPNTVAGCATVGTPTSGTIGFDFSQQTAAEVSSTDLASVTASLVVTSATGGFRRIMTGNILHITSGTNDNPAWYEVVNYTDGNTITVDRDCTNGVNMSTAVGALGGAFSMNSTLDDDAFELAIAGSTVFVNGNLTLGEGVSIGSGSAGTATSIVNLIGYQTVRGDNPTGTNRPTITQGALAFTLATRWSMRNIIFTGTAATMATAGASGRVTNCKFTNTSTTAARIAFAPATSFAFNNEVISYRGTGISWGSSDGQAWNNYIHDSNIGIRTTAADTTQYQIVGNIIESCVTAAIEVAGAVTGQVGIYGNTLFGATNTTGLGINLVTGSVNQMIINNIITGFTTGVTHADTQTQGYDDFNDYYNNDADVSAAGQWQKGPNSIAVNPSFTNVGQVTFATGTTSGSVLTQSGATFVTDGVVAGRDYLYLVSGTGITAGIYGITAVTETTLTLDIAPGANATADKVGQITTGRNFMITGNI